MAGSPAIRPPRMARASGALAPLPRSSAKAVGIIAKKAASAVIVAGRTRTEAALRIVSPLDGVITLRTYNISDFIRASDTHSGPPLLSVARTDLMRLVM